MSRNSLAGSVVVASWLVACASSGPACPVTVPVVAVAPAVTVSDSVSPVAAASSSAPRVATAPRGLCWARGKPQMKVTAPKASTYCAPFEEAELKRVEARLRRDFRGLEKHSRLIVDFGCDTASAQVREVLFESGNGHGGSLRLVRLQRESARVVVRMIERLQYSHEPSTRVKLAELEPGAFDRAIEQARVAMLARPHLIHLRTSQGGASFSSRDDFHVRIALTDPEGNTLDGQFTGYPSGREQERWLPMQLAAEPLAKLIQTATLQEVTASDEDRAYFSGRFVLTMSETPDWWVKERYVAIAATLGTMDVVPALARLASTPGDGSVKRTRTAAMEAIAAITGWDPRVDEGTPRSDEEAARVAVVECVP